MGKTSRRKSASWFPLLPSGSPPSSFGVFSSPASVLKKQPFHPFCFKKKKKKKKVFRCIFYSSASLSLFLSFSIEASSSFGPLRHPPERPDRGLVGRQLRVLHAEPLELAADLGGEVVVFVVGGGSGSGSASGSGSGGGGSGRRRRRRARRKLLLLLFLLRAPLSLPVLPAGPDPFGVPGRSRGATDGSVRGISCVK